MGFMSRLFGSEESAKKLAQHTPTKLAGKTVAFAESSETIRRILELAFDGAGAESKSFESPMDLVASLSEIEPAVVLLSAGGLGSGDATITKGIKDRFPGVVVFLLKASTDKLDPEVENQPGFDGVVNKPFKADRLLEEIEEKISW